MAMDAVSHMADRCGQPRPDDKTLDSRHTCRAWRENPARRVLRRASFNASTS